MGHVLNNTIQDVLIRKARMEGKNTCWIPGIDHASIATETKVVKMLEEREIPFRKVPDCFAYNSGTNSHFLSINDLRNLIKQNIEPNFKPI